MNNKVCNFEKNLKNEQKYVSPKIFSDIAEYLQDNIKLLQFLEEDIYTRLKNYKKITGKNINDFELDERIKNTLLRKINFDGYITFNFYTKPENDVSFHATIKYNLEDDIVIDQIEKLVNDQIDSVYDRNTKIWKKKKPIPEKFLEIIKSHSSESDILKMFMELGVSKEEEYFDIKRRYNPLFVLYDKVNEYMNPDLIFDPNGSYKMILEPRDYLRYGFCVGLEKKELLLMQYVGISDVELELEKFLIDGHYEKIVGRTNNPEEMKNVLSRLADHHTRNSIYTIPVSLNHYIETRKLSSLINDIGKYRDELDDEEFQNLEQICNFFQN